MKRDKTVNMCMNTRMSESPTGNIESTLAARLSELMRERALTQQQLSFELRVGPSVINRWVNERNAMSAASIVMIARYFNVSADWLLGLSDTRHHAPPTPRTAEEVVAMADELVSLEPPGEATQTRRRP